jgi:hypothetical protein
MTHHDPLLLFLTGLPNKITVEYVTAKCCEFGNFRLLTLKSTSTSLKVVLGNSMVNLRKGFCVMEALDKESFDNSLRIAYTTIGPNSVKIAKFMQGNELENFCQENEAKIVIAREVPRTYSKLRLQSQIERLFGKTNRVFRLDSPTSIEITKTASHFCSYSIEFEHADSAANALLASGVYLDDVEQRICLESFKRKIPKNKNLVVTFPYLKNQITTTRKPNDVSKTIQSFPTKAGDTGCSKCGLTSELCRFSLLMHNKRPTSTLYFPKRVGLLRKFQDAQILPLFETGNLRFNIGKSLLNY